jgi:tetratricopeptide (TPR) repeat protein
MNKKALVLSIIAILGSFVGGFLLANALNRSELDQMRAENARLKNSSADQLELTDDEIRQKIAEADQNPTNFDFQKNLALGLYRYAGLKQDAKYLPDVTRLLLRALESKPRDYETIVALGNAHLDLGQINKDQAAIEQSREFYRRALAIKKDDADVQNDLGLTYFFSVPPDAEKAIAEYEKALQMNPKHEKAMENLVRALLSAGKTKEAGDYLKRLRETNPKNQSLPDLEAQVARGGDGGGGNKL